MTQQQRLVTLVGALVVSATLAGCAGSSNDRRDDRDRGGRRSSNVPPAQAELTQARASIDAATQAGATEYGSAQLALAREKLRAAEDAAADDDVERARRLAIEADLDADFAAAISRNRETQQLAGEVRDGLRTLERELERAEPATQSTPLNSN
jgi:hypothetical protein